MCTRPRVLTSEIPLIEEEFRLMNEPFSYGREIYDHFAKEFGFWSTAGFCTKWHIHSDGRLSLQGAYEEGKFHVLIDDVFAEGDFILHLVIPNASAQRDVSIPFVDGKLVEDRSEWIIEKDYSHDNLMSFLQAGYPVISRTFKCGNCDRWGLHLLGQRDHAISKELAHGDRFMFYDVDGMTFCVPRAKRIP